MKSLKSNTTNASKPDKKEKPTATAYVTPAQFAEIIGVTRPRVAKAIKDEIIFDSLKTVKHGNTVRHKIHKQNGLVEWDEKIDQSKRRFYKENERDGESEKNLYKDAQAKKEFYAAKMAELNFKEKAARLINADMVKAENSKIIQRVSKTFLSVPDRVSTELAGMKDSREINIFLKEHFVAVLQDLGNLKAIERSES